MSNPANSAVKRRAMLLGDRVSYRSLLTGILVIWLIGFLVGAWAPTTVLDDHWLARQYASVMSFVADPRGLIQSKSNFPQVTALYHAVIVWGLPLWFMLWWKWMNSQVGPNKTDMIFKASLSFGNRLTLLLLLPLWLFLAYAAFSLNHGGNTRMFAFGTSRLALAIFGMGGQIAASGMLALALFSIKRLITINNPGERK